MKTTKRLRHLLAYGSHCRVQIRGISKADDWLLARIVCETPLRAQVVETDKIWKGVVIGLADARIRPLREAVA